MAVYVNRVIVLKIIKMRLSIHLKKVKGSDRLQGHGLYVVLKSLLYTGICVGICIDKLYVCVCVCACACVCV